MTVEGLSRDEARRLTDEAKVEAHELAEHLLTLYECGAHVALGYDAWKDYVSEEFAIGLADASRRLNVARVMRALEQYPLADIPAPSAKVAGEVLGRTLPYLSRPADAPPDWTADDDDTRATVAQAWRVAIDHAEGDTPTAREAKHALTRAGFIPDTASGASGPPSWGEAIGRVGDDLIRARKDMDKFEQLLDGAQVNKYVSDKAARYVVWADELATRLRAVEIA